MLFNSYAYLFFLPVVFLLYWGVFCRYKDHGNAFIVASSFWFYGSWNVRFLALMVCVILLSYWCGILVARAPEGWRRKGVVWLNCIANIGILCIFKYFNFFAESLRDIFSLFSVYISDVTLDLVLPVGISFYTFQAVAYVVDVYRGTVAPCRNPVTFAAFLSFFPQLVAGPIERAGNLLPQFEKPRRFTQQDGTEGCKLILWGLFKKMVVADNCGQVVDYVFNGFEHMSSATLALGVILYSFQIYGDFSGYSDIAIGSARLFGIRLSRNFNYPCMARSVPEFWSRWHISLSTWFRDYIYIPLGGGWFGRHKKARNILTVFFVSGLWHGAGYGYIVWGGLHGLAHLPYIYASSKFKVIKPKITPGVRELWMIMLTFVFVALSRIPFRASTISDAWGYAVRLFSAGGWQVECSRMPVLWCVLLMSAEWLRRSCDYPLAFEGTVFEQHRWMRWTLYYALVFIIIIFQGSSANFIYFQF